MTAMTQNENFENMPGQMRELKNVFPVFQFSTVSAEEKKLS